MMEEQYFTQANWKVKPGNEQRFIDTWTKLANRLAADPSSYGALWGLLIQSTDDPAVFRTVGKWQSREAAAAINPQAHPELAELVSLCTEGSPGVYRLVRHVEAK